jgi:hypothetical protein
VRQKSALKGAKPIRLSALVLALIATGVTVESCVSVALLFWGLKASVEPLFCVTGITTGAAIGYMPSSLIDHHEIF